MKKSKELREEKQLILFLSLIKFNDSYEQSFLVYFFFN
jgi:hypothetical protein